MSQEYITDTAELYASRFKVGGTINLNRLKFYYYRDGIAYFLCRRLLDEALGKGFDIKQKGEIVNWFDDAKETIFDVFSELIAGGSFERRDGKSLIAFMKSEKKLIFRSFPRRRYKDTYMQIGNY